MVTVEESGIIFGHFSPDELFEVEKSALLHSLKGDVKCAEFVWYQHAKLCLWVIEAKTTLPTHNATLHLKDNEILKLRDKLVNSFNLCVASMLGIHTDSRSELPNNLSLDTIAQWSAYFLVVLAKEPEETRWLPPLQKELNRLMLPFLKTWGLDATSVRVVMPTEAQKLGLPIISNQHDL